MRNYWSFQSAGQLLFGRGAIRDLGHLVSQRGFRKVLLISDPNLVAVGLADQVLAPLAAANIDTKLCDVGVPEPSIAVAEEAATQARAFQPDCLIGLGGGSNLDLAKIVAVLLRHGGHPQQYFSFNNVPGPIAPLVAIPTTAGTGSEVSHAAVLTDLEQHLKVSTLSPHLRPLLAIVDPALTDRCPRQVTADSGIDALTHAVEAFTATDFHAIPGASHEPQAYEGRHPLGTCLAEQAIRLVGEHLVKVVQDGTNQAARDGMALAATLAGLAFSNCGVALVHALEYPLGGALHCTHGAGNGLLLPHVMRFLLPVRTPEFAHVAMLLGVNTAGLSTTAAAELAIATVERINQQIGIPARIRDLGGRREQLPAFAAKSFAIKRLLATTPRPASEADLLDILEGAF
jgi:alcohol dehydrogenase class IV